MRKYLTSQAALKEMGLRLKSYRVYSSLTQDDLAKKAGVSRRSIQYLEDGNNVSFTTVIKTLMVLELDSNLDLLIPDPTKRPSYYLNASSNKNVRFRASKKVARASNKEFKWGDES